MADVRFAVHLDSQHGASGAEPFKLPHVSSEVAAGSWGEFADAMAVQEMHCGTFRHEFEAVADDIVGAALPTMPPPPPIMTTPRTAATSSPATSSSDSDVDFLKRFLKLFRLFCNSLAF